VRIEADAESVSSEAMIPPPPPPPVASTKSLELTGFGRELFDLDQRWVIKGSTTV